MRGLGRVLIVGAAGQLGQQLRLTFAGIGELICRDREGLNLTREEHIREVVRQDAPDVILNAAAYTAVDQAEEKPELAMAVNCRAPLILAEEAARRNALLVHYSTDYVFDGTKQGSWSESDQPNPLNVYGQSKLAGERAVASVGGAHLILRTSWLYAPHGNNFLLRMLNLGRERDMVQVVSDQWGAPTSTAQLAMTTRAMVERAVAGRHGSPRDWSGIYHASCQGSTSWCGFAEAIFNRATRLLGGRTPRVSPILSRDYAAKAERPLNSVLSNAKLKKMFGVELARWEAALDDVLRELSDRS